LETVLHLKHGNELQLPKIYANDDVRTSDNLVAYFINRFSKLGDVVFDPFAGFGTTLYIAEKLGRIGFGVEYLLDRVDYIKSIIENKDNIICGNALNLSNIDVPKIDFSFTSPPYMSKNKHKEYPFAAYQISGAGYDQYLLDMKDIYRQLRLMLKPDAYAVIEVSNIINDGIMTPLAWDVANSVSEVLCLEKEVIVEWEGCRGNGNYGFGYDHCYCLIFRNKLDLK
jgi:hypothetical protein